jgi:ankyrin repeat protein
MLIEKNPADATIVNNMTGWTPFLIAMSKDNVEVASYLLTMGVDVNQASTKLFFFLKLTITQHSLVTLL